MPSTWYLATSLFPLNSSTPSLLSITDLTPNHSPSTLRYLHSLLHLVDCAAVFVSFSRILLFVAQADAAGNSSSTQEGLLADLQDALSKQRPNCASSFKLNKAMESRYQSQIRHRLTELEGSLF